MIALLLAIACQSPDGDPAVSECAHALWADADRDGHGDAAAPTDGCDSSAVANPDDCDDADAAIHPHANEVCNGADDDCDGRVDVDSIDAPTWYEDRDLDGFGGAETVIGCEAPAQFVATAGDCDDANAARNPDAEEICNEIDDDCDALVDALDDDLADGTVWYDDVDDDGYGDQATGALLCAQPDGSVEAAGDCDDGDATVNPDASEVCDGFDNDCDVLVDDEDPDVITTDVFYEDLDGDGLGNADATTGACIVPAGFTDNSDDCDDASAKIGAAVGYYYDRDGDGYGAGIRRESCTPDSDDVLVDGDCDDREAAIHPGATEICNEEDDNCDGATDEADPLLTDGTLFYADVDGDGYGNTTDFVVSCASHVRDRITTSGDCDDADASLHPGATEWCDAIDNDCSGAADDSVVYVDWFADADGDGFGDPDVSENDCVQPSGYLVDSADCDDADAAVSPDALESCDTDVDDDCDGTSADCVWSVDDADAFVSGSPYSLAFGDFDADGTADFVIGERDAAYIVRGPVSGESNVDDVSIRLSTTVEGGIGSSLDVVDGGDANGDETDDLLVGATVLSAAYLFLGPITTARDVADADAEFGTPTSLEIGSEVDLGPDFDGDGLDDAVLGAPYDSTGSGGSRVYVASGAASGTVDLTTDATHIYGGVTGQPIGYSDTSVGDVDGDGFDDLAICDNSEHVYLVTGGAPTGTYDVDATATATVTGSVNNMRAGPVGADYDSDGYSDLLVPGPDCVWAFLGPLSATLDETDASVTWQAEEAGLWSFGTQGLGTGDVDGDKEPDVVIGDFGFDKHRYAGAAYVQLGLATGVVDASALPSFQGDRKDYLGWRVGTVADWTGDGSDELVIGAKDGPIAVFLSDGLF